MIETFVSNELPKLLRADTREEQGERVQMLMSDMTEKYDNIFPDNSISEDGLSLNGEGIENCVMKNLY